MFAAQSAAGGAGYPLIILLLLVAWGLFVAGLVSAVLQERHDRQGRMRLASGLVAALLAVVLAVLLSPVPPVVCTYTGLSHITSAYHLAALEWQWAFPTDYPLTVPALAAPFVLLMGRVPEAFGAANLLLAALGGAGGALLAGRLWRSRSAAWSGGLAVATTPFLLLFARGDGLNVGYLALSLWTAYFGLLVVRGEAGRLTRLALVGALIITAQTRAEAVLFLLVVAALPVTLPASEWRSGSRRILPLLGLALLGLVPHLANLTREFAGTERSLAAEIGFHHAWKYLLATGFLAATLAAAGSVVRVRAVPYALPATLLVLLVAALAAGFGESVLTSATHCWGTDCLAETYRTIGFWLLSPKLVPMVLPALVLVGLFAFRSAPEARTVAWLVLWCGGVAAVASIKMTGELPYEGARTQLPALGPGAVVAALGVHRLVYRTGSFCIRWAGGLAAALVVTLYSPIHVVADHGFDEQAEFRFVRECLPKLPERSLLLAPDDVLDVVMLGDAETTSVDLFHLYRTAYLAEALGDDGRMIRVVPFLEQADGGAGKEPVYWFRSLNCYRTGDGSLTPSCRRALSRPDLVPVCETTVDNRTYTADYFDETRIVGQTVVLGIYAWPATAKEAHAVP